MRDVTIRMSSLNGVANPSAGVVFSSLHKLAQTVLTGATVMDDQPVFSVVLHGNFIGYLAHTPTGVIPTGSVMTITFDASTLEVTDWSMQHVAPTALASLGIGTALGV